MKRFCKWFLLLLVVTLLLSACEKEDDTVSEDVFEPGENGFWDLNDLVWGEIEFPVTGLYGVPKETLLQTETPVRAGDTWDPTEKELDTEDSFLFQLTASSCQIPIVYDKSTGRFSYACADPLCLHKNCIWSGFPDFYGSGELNELFLVRGNLGGGLSSIYSCGIHGENPRKLYESGGRITKLVRDGGYLYFLEDGFDEETGEEYSQLIRLDILYKTFRILRSHVRSMLPMGDKVLYTDNTDWNCYFYDLETKEKTLFGENCSPFAYWQGWIYYTSDGALYRASAEDTSVREQVLEQTHLCLTVAEDRLYYVKREIFATSEEFPPYYMGDVYACALDGSGETLVWDMDPYATKGIPVNVCNLHTDGKLLHIEYKTYLDFRNMFYPEFGMLSREQGDQYELFIDLSTGEELRFMGANSDKYKS